MKPARVPGRTRGRSGATLATALALAFVLACANTPAAAGPRRFLVPSPGARGTVAWVADSLERPRWMSKLPRPPRTRAESLIVWRAALVFQHLQDPASYFSARLRLAGADTAGADSGFAAVSTSSLWGWRALAARVALAEATRGPAVADSLLAASYGDHVLDAGKAERLAIRVRLRAAMGDTATAADFALQAAKVYGGSPATRGAIAILDSLLATRRDTLPFPDVRVIANSEASRGRVDAALARLAPYARSVQTSERMASHQQSAAFLRASRRWGPARAEGRAAYSTGFGSALHAEAALEVARAFAGEGKRDSALVWFAAAMAESLAGTRLDFAARWEAGREAEDGGLWNEAARFFARAASVPGPDPSEARFRAGLMHFAAGRPDSARAWFDRSGTEAARFWNGVTARALGDSARGNALLRALAALPGWTFHRVSARDTLGLRGWPGELERAYEPLRNYCDEVAQAEDLASLGFADESALVVASLPFEFDDDRESCDAGAIGLAAARAGYALERPRLAIAAAERAIRRISEADREPGLVWRRLPWTHPPAYEPLVRALSDSLALEPALLWAVLRQESRFDPTARSSSGALGLMQLLIPAATDVTVRRREAAPSEARLLDPATNLRLGARYLARLIARFEGHVGVALSAYNAGPSTVPAFWRELIARGGEALFCEIASNADAQDYTRKILANRAGYRELRPSMSE